VRRTDAPIACAASLEEHEWRRSARRHRRDVLGLLGMENEGDEVSVKLHHDPAHPIFNFILEYYGFNHADLHRYSPGSCIFLQGALADDPRLHRKAFVAAEGGGFFDPGLIPEKRLAWFKWIAELLRVTMDREPSFKCFGLHEWAMLYRPAADEDAPVSRFQQLRLRLSQQELNMVVEAGLLSCTHYDASRHFPHSALPLNAIQPPPSKSRRLNLEQPGCVHTNMDLFKWAVKAVPFIPSDIVREALSIAIEARVLDMRASPYDLTKVSLQRGSADFDASPVRVETAGGREDYQLMQWAIHRRAKPLRERLLHHYEKMLTDAAGRRRP